jgi:hypothetical protein
VFLIGKICASERLTVVLEKAAFPDRRHAEILLRCQFFSLLLAAENIHAKMEKFPLLESTTYE